MTWSRAGCFLSSASGGRGISLIAHLALSFVKAAAAVAGIILFLWACGLLNVAGTVGVGGMVIILLGIFWSIFFDTGPRSLGRIGAFCLAYLTVSQALHLVLEPRGLVRADLRFVLELVGLCFGSLLLFTSNGAARSSGAAPPQRS